MSPAPWWVTIVIGVLTVAGSFLAARIGAAQTRQATDQRELAAAREEWFRRMQWAADLSLRDDARSRAAGLALLAALGDSPLAHNADLELLWALNANADLDELESNLVDDLDDTDFIADDDTDTEEDQHGNNEP
ncbi:hypothetical protein [Nakamurella endophytica]|uniref:Uncharacterized protein n=1 Tax=Nakamurella endophytica TaxID=1748367 RepID=A0A917WK66_9ACTN|nr:hypothetical protein [Nakamurella endophytica]GGM10148.1 hypothetical protein GCM10011594_32580 [Nakamurella endophytica]